MKNARLSLLLSLLLLLSSSVFLVIAYQYRWRTERKISVGLVIHEDITPPVIENVFQQPANDSVYPDDKVEVYANVTDDISGVKQVILNYTTNNGTWFSKETTNLKGNLYNATIPQFPYCTNVTYIIIAEDNANNTITTEEMEHEYQYHVIPELPTWTSMLLILIVLTVAIAIYKPRLLKTLKC